MSGEHIQFVTIGFADLIANLPTVYCAHCGEGISNLRGVYQLEELGLVFCDQWCYSDWAPGNLEDSAVTYDEPDVYDHLERDLWDQREPF